MCQVFQNLGHDVAISANFGLHGNTLNWNDVKIYPRYRGGMGADVIEVHAKDFGADVVLSLYDIWVLDPNIHERIPCPWVGMVPVDGSPLSSKMRQIARTIDFRVAYSRFGEHEMKRAGLDCDFVPHAIDTDQFSPTDDKYELRDQLGIPREKFLVTVVAANKGYPCRKGWPELLEAYAHFRRNHLDALLYLHTTNLPFGSQGEGINIQEYIRFLGYPKGSWMMVNEADLALGVPDQHLINFYRASDVFLLPSLGEGFGLPVLEAQACGCPVIVQNASATAELCVNGVAIEPLQHLWLPQLGYYWQLPSIPRIVQALELVYNQDPSVQFWAEKREEGIRWARENYSLEVVQEQYWRPLWADIERRLW